jgi:hypothetical protein
MGPIAKSRCKMKKTYTHVKQSQDARWKKHTLMWSKVKMQDEKNIHSCEAKSRCKMKKKYNHVNLQAYWNQGKASLELIEWTHTLKIDTLSSLKCLKSNITYTIRIMPKLVKVLNFTLTSPHHITQLIYLFKMVKISQSPQTKPQK